MEGLATQERSSSKACPAWKRRPPIPDIHGNTIGLKASHKKRLMALYRRNIARDAFAPPPFVRALVDISHEIERQVAVTVDRRGAIQQVIVGDANRIEIPYLGRIREGQGRFRGLRLIHTHLDNEPLSRDDLNDLSINRLDLMMAVGVGEEGLPGEVYYAYLLPQNPERELWRQEGPMSIYDLEDEPFQDWIASLEDEFSKANVIGSEVAPGNKALLIGVYSPSQLDADARMDELEQLALSAGLFVMSRVVQRRDQPDPRWMLGQGKVEEVVLHSIQLGVEVLVFDSELNPTQSRNIADQTDLRILDRSQLILDIFAQKAHSKDGKLQVELAQLKYLLPRLNRMNKAMSRLTGGIGGRGPGETKLEINRRRARERISRLEKKLVQVQRQRTTRRKKRLKQSAPIISVVGYTNAGKSTLVNTLTQSDVLIENRLFSTLDPVSRRLRFPSEREVILTDTVGFIRDLPPELVNAFRATLEELQDADLLLHVVDLSDPAYVEQIEAVVRILGDLELEQKPRVLVFNKLDRVDVQEAENLCHRHQAIGISAQDIETLTPLLEVIERHLLTLAHREPGPNDWYTATPFHLDEDIEYGQEETTERQEEKEEEKKGPE